MADGPPTLKCSPSWAHVLLRELHPDRCADLGFRDDTPWQTRTISVSVEWAAGGHSSDEHILAVRLGATEVARSTCTQSHAPLSCTFEWSLAQPGETFVCELRWRDRRVHLHILRPLEPAGISFKGLLLAPSMREQCGLGGGARLPRCAVDRGVGIEVELLTPAPSIPRQASLLKGKGSKQDAWRAAAEAARGDDEDPRWLDRCAMWEAGEDVYIFPSPAPVPALMLGQLEANHLPSGERLSAEERDALLAHMTFGEALGAPAPAGTHKTEFRSPLPPHELNFARGAAEELRAFIRLVGSMGPTAAASLSPSYFSATSLHVHVNVRCAASAGELLTARELLAVWLEWVRFDHVTSRLARPWVWREPWCAPLHVTGAEFAMGEAAWSQGGEEFREEPSAQRRYNVREFIAGAHAEMRSAEWRLRDVAGQVALLFDPAEYADESDGGVGGAFKPFKAALTRYCSLNLESIAKHGTLEFRRFHGTCDAAVIAHWASFCVSFVEAFRSSELVAHVFDAPLEEGLALLEAAQEAATVGELERRMADSVRGWDASTIRFLIEDACPGALSSQTANDSQSGIHPSPPVAMSLQRSTGGDGDGTCGVS